jgi:hypothetical protein
VQLERIEGQLQDDDSPGLTTIEPGASFARTYVLKFKRPMFEQRKYQLAFDAEYVMDDILKTSSVATTLRISPYPLVLNIVAMAAAILGMLIRESLAGSQTPAAQILWQAQTGQLLVGPIVALVFFNAYEYTSLGKGFAMRVSWRSSLLIGTICGLAQDRILEALKALLGV